MKTDRNRWAYLVRKSSRYTSSSLSEGAEAAFPLACDAALHTHVFNILTKKCIFCGKMLPFLRSWLNVVIMYTFLEGRHEFAFAAVQFYLGFRRWYFLSCWQLRNRHAEICTKQLKNEQHGEVHRPCKDVIVIVIPPFTVHRHGWTHFSILHINIINKIHWKPKLTWWWTLFFSRPP